MTYNPHPERTHRDATSNDALQELANRRRNKAREAIRGIGSNAANPTTQELVNIARANATIEAWDEVYKLADTSVLPYTEPTATPTPFEDVRMRTESGTKLAPLDNFTLADLKAAADEYTDQHIRAEEEIQAIGATMAALSSVLNLDYRIKEKKETETV